MQVAAAPMAVALVGLASAAQAIPLTCGGPTGTRTVTVDPGESCVTSGLGNLGDPALGVYGTLVERDAANTNGGLLSLTGVDAGSGTWTIASSVWNTFAELSLYFHFGHGAPTTTQFNPDWFLVEVASGATTGTWSVNPSQLALSNVAVIGRGTPVGVPEPATAALLSAGLGLLGLTRLRRKRPV